MDASRTLGPGVDPCLDQLTQTRLRAWHALASGTGSPAPGDQIILREVLLQQRQVASAIAVAILQLRADFAPRLPFPCHFDRRQAPPRMPGDALIAGIVPDDGEIAVRVARAAGIARHAAAVVTAGDGRH